MVVPGGSGTVPDARGQLCGGLPAALLFGLGVGFGGGKALVQSLALGGGQFPLWLVCPRSLIAGAPVLPPDGGRSIHKRLVRAVLAVGPVRCAATVQKAVSLNGLDLQPRCTQTLDKTVQNVALHPIFKVFYVVHDAAAELGVARANFFTAPAGQCACLHAVHVGNFLWG